jgi:hypothetical protein
MGASESKNCDCKDEESNKQAVLPVDPSVKSLTNKVDDGNKGQTDADVAPPTPGGAEQGGGRYKKNRKRSRKNVKKYPKRSKGSNKNRL